MQVKDIKIPYTNSASEFKLYMLGDIHAGTIHCAEEKVKEKIKEIASSPNNYWIGMGDYGEFITPRDPRFDPSQRAIAPWVEQDNIGETQRKWIVELLTPIKEQCVGLLYGNHEDSMRIHNSDNVQKNICEDLGVSNLGYSCFVRYIFDRENSNETHIIRGAFTHGTGCAITKGAKVNKLRRFMDDFDARIYGYGHVHDVDDQLKPYLTLSPQGKIKQLVAVGCLTGCWFRTYTQGVVASYGEKKVYPPTVIGCPTIIINPQTDEVKAVT